MKFNKSLIALAVTGALAVPGIQHAQAAEHTFTWGGNLQVQSISETTDITTNATGVDKTTGVETLTTEFGGLDADSGTGGDTHLQLNYGYASDDGATTGSGFIRFGSHRQVRINVEANSEGDTYAASMKAEWEQLGLDGGPDGDSREDRDQFAILTHKGTGLYFKIGREEWLGNEKGYTTDFLSFTKGYSDTGNGRFAGHLLGWSSSDLGLDVGLFLQRDNSGQNDSARPLGAGFDSAFADETGDVNGAGLLVNYVMDGLVEVELFSGSSTVAANADRGDSEHEQTVAVTQLHLGLAFGNYKPFLNFGSQTITSNTGETGAKDVEVTDGGNNLGISVGFGFADLVVAFGSAAAKDAAEKETTNSGFDLMFATNTDPLLVSLAYSSDTKEVTPKGGKAVETATSKYGVRFDYGF